MHHLGDGFSIKPGRRVLGPDVLGNTCVGDLGCGRGRTCGAVSKLSDGLASLERSRRRAAAGLCSGLVICSASQVDWVCDCKKLERSAIVTSANAQSPTDAMPVSNSAVCESSGTCNSHSKLRSASAGSSSAMMSCERKTAARKCPMQEATNSMQRSSWQRGRR